MLMNMPLIQKPKSSQGASKTRTRKSEVLGVTKDGVKILKPVRKATNFTVKEAREAVARALGKSA
jgi:ribosomal protein L7/L12